MKQIRMFFLALIIYLFIAGIIVWILNIDWDGPNPHVYMRSMQGVVVAYEEDENGLVIVLRNSETEKLEWFQLVEDSVCTQDVKYIIENRIYGDDVISISYYEETDYPAYEVYVAQLVPKETETDSTEDISSIPSE